MSTSHQNERITNAIVYILFLRNKASKSDMHFTGPAPSWLARASFQVLNSPGGERLRYWAATGQSLAVTAT